MNKQRAFINEQSDAKIVTEDEEEKLKELKRKRNRERQRAYYHRQKDLKKNMKKIREKVPISNAERQRRFRQRNAEKFYLDMRRQKLNSKEENVVQCRPVENIENVTLQVNQFHSQQLQIYEQRNECITPEVILHRNTGIPFEAPARASGGAPRGRAGSASLADVGQGSRAAAAQPARRASASAAPHSPDSDMELNNLSVLGANSSPVRYCSVIGCQATTASHPHYKFYRLPRKADRSTLWLQKIQLKGSNCNICERHFEERFFTPKRRLTQNAVPTLFLPLSSDTFSPDCDDGSQEVEDIFDNDEFLPDEDAKSENLKTVFVPVKIEYTEQNTATTSSQLIESPLKRKSSYTYEWEGIDKIIKIKEEPECLTVFIDEDDDEIIGNQSEYVPALENLPEVTEDQKSRKYSTDFKFFALDLYFKSSNAYRLFQRTFGLPRISTIYRLCIPRTSDLHDDLFRALSLKVVDMTSAQKQCVVCVSNLSLSPIIEYDAVNDKIYGFQELDGVQTLVPAQDCLIIIVRGIFHSWKQAIAFSFLRNLDKNTNINFFIDTTIRRLIEIGLNVRALMSDLKSDLLTATRDRVINKKEKPFFIVNNRKIYYMYDPLLLISNIRDNFIANNIIFCDGMAAKWSHVVECYEYDRKRGLLRLAPKLSDDHIRPKKDAQGSVSNLKLTAEFFTTTTAAALHTCIDLQVLEPAANDTVQWILTISKLMDMLNFSTFYPPEDKSSVFSGEIAQVEFLEKILSLFPNLSVLSQKVANVHYSNNKNIVVFRGFIMTIKSILLLCEELKTENCWMPIVGLSHDCLNVFFDKIHQKYGPQPTAKQITMCITKWPIFSVFQFSCKKRTADELESFLSRARQVTNVDMHEQESTEVHVDECGDASAEFAAVELPSEGKVEHLSLYLLNKAHQRHCNCELLNYSLLRYCILADNTSDTKLLGYMKFETKTNTFAQQFVVFVEVLELKFKEYFKENRLTRSIAGLQSFVRHVRCGVVCDCFPIEFVKQLFLRYRLYTVLRYNNAYNNSKENYNPQFVVNDL